jgi:HEAT repeat protein
LDNNEGKSQIADGEGVGENWRQICRARNDRRAQQFSFEYEGTAGSVLGQGYPLCRAAMIAALNNFRSSMKERGEDSEFHKPFGAFRGLDGPSPSVSISYVREAAAIGLGEIGDASAVPALIAALEDDDPDVIKAATRALVKVGTPALPGLIAALKHRRLRVRRLAAAALGEIGDQSGVPPLEDADRKYHESYHCEFCDALRRLDAK